MSRKELQQAAWELLAMLDALPPVTTETAERDTAGRSTAAGENALLSLKRLPVLRASEEGTVLPPFETAELRGEPLPHAGTEVSLLTPDGTGESGSFDAEERGRTEPGERVFSPLRAEDIEELDRRFRRDSRRYDASPGREY